MRIHFRKILLIFSLLAIAVFIRPVLADSIDGYIESLEVSRESKNFLKTREDFRSRITSDSDGILVRRLLREPNLATMLYANFDVIPDRYHLEVIAEMLVDKNYWKLASMGSISRHETASNIMSNIVFPGNDGLFKDLHLAFHSTPHRKKISNILLNLSHALKSNPDQSEELKKEAVEKISQIIYTPYDYSDPEITEILRENTPPNWKPLEDRNARRRENPLNRDVSETTDEAEEPSRMSAWIWSGLITLCLALAGFVFFRMQMASKS